MFDNVSERDFNELWDVEIAVKYFRENQGVLAYYGDSFSTLSGRSRKDDSSIIEIIGTATEAIYPFRASGSWYSYAITSELWEILKGDKPKEPKKKRKPSVRVQGKRVSKKKLKEMFGA